MDMKAYEEKAKAIALAAGKAAGKQLILEVLLPMAKDAAASSENKWDDMAMVALEDSVKKFVEGL